MGACLELIGRICVEPRTRCYLRYVWSLGRCKYRTPIRCHNYTHCSHFTFLYAILSWKEILIEKLLKRVEVNEEGQEAHRAKNSIKYNTKYVEKTLKDQNWDTEIM